MDENIRPRQGKQMELRILRAIDRRNWELWIWIRAVPLKAHGHFRSPVPSHYTEMARRVAGAASLETRARSALTSYRHDNAWSLEVCFGEFPRAKGTRSV